MAAPAALPARLVAQFDDCLARFRDQAPAASVDWLDRQRGDQNFSAELIRVWGGSEFVAEACIQAPELLRNLVDSGDIADRHDEGVIEARLRRQLAGVGSEADFQRVLRCFRRRELVRIVWRDLSRRADLAETVRDMSALADACIRGTLDFLHPRVCAEMGTPLAAGSAEPQQLVVIAMGKLGGDELNVSSDIDLIFAYPEEGETEGAKRRFSHREFFVRLGQKLIQTLDNRTADGFVFRVDMRLRPFGQSGALAYGFTALEQYYQQHGRDWERYAMIKARAITGEPRAAAELVAMLRAFTYRKYIDYSVIESLREMKAMINREVQRRGLDDDIKRGAGGIREIEFIVQSFQLIRGGRDPRFQNPRLRDVLGLLGSEGMLPVAAAADLWLAYEFLRNLEHVLQAWRDQQTQQLPAADEDRARVAALMGFAHWRDFVIVLDHHRARVRTVFAGIVADRGGVAADNVAPDSRALEVWRAITVGDAVAVADELAALGYGGDSGAVADLLARLVTSQRVRLLPVDARTRLDRFMPRLIGACAKMNNGAESLQRALQLVEAVARRSAYLVLLIENPTALEQLVRLCAASPWIAAEISAYPALLDELLDPQTLYTPPDRAVLQDQLRQQALRIPVDDLEAQLEALRYFRRAHALRVAAGEVMATLPLMKVSDYLTWLAEAILNHVLALAWDHLIARFGAPGKHVGREPAFLIVGYGKLGGIELGHGSDLDLVFIYDADPTLATAAATSIDNGTFFVRLGQRIIHILSARTATGALYDVDMRLRPSGNSGLLVTSLDAFVRYQEQSAWTWEHQALVRARPVAGDAGLAERFEQIRERILVRRRDPDMLRREVVAMRERMSEHLGSKSGQGEVGIFDLKQGRGGIVDIEFMVQFAVLAEASAHPELTRWTDNIRILDALAECGVLSAVEAEELREAYKDFRIAGHRQQLQQQPALVPAGDFAARRAAVISVWQRLLGTTDGGDGSGGDDGDKSA
ncbi:MAG: bifunctional [glutamate--ammonia ligase]-adenylyl-L-tyrosine phosphorylase/[glutamate--ammonia-ligase] adenylyltransferase [Porticoccaceae bacterium]